MKTTDFVILLSKYFTYYLSNERGSSPQSIESYRYIFILYIEYIELERDIKQKNDYQRLYKRIHTGISGVVGE